MEAIKDKAAYVKGRDPATISKLLHNVAGLPLALLDGKHHPCPRCGGSDRFRLISPSRGRVLCNQCFPLSSVNIDLFDAIKHYANLPFAAAVEKCYALANEQAAADTGFSSLPGADSNGTMKPLVNGSPAKSAENIRRTARYWDYCWRDHPRVTQYLRFRGLSGYADQQAIRYADGQWLFLAGGEKVVTGALVAAFRTNAGKVVGAHRTHLDPNGPGKYPGPNVKRFFAGSQCHGASVHLGRINRGQGLVVCEGLETGLAVRESTGYAVRCLCTCTLMRSYTPPLEAAWVVVACDNDEHGAGQKAGAELMKRCLGLGMNAALAVPGYTNYDWLDYLQLYGKDSVRVPIFASVREAIERGVKP